jgi:hypothetical protein
MPERTPNSRKRRGRRTEPPASESRERARRVDDASSWTVEDDLPRPIPVARAEIDVLETFLGRLIDDILRELSDPWRDIETLPIKPIKSL